jgi:hypothetical protein
VSVAWISRPACSARTAWFTRHDRQLETERHARNREYLQRIQRRPTSWRVRTHATSQRGRRDQRQHPLI